MTRLGDADALRRITSTLLDPAAEPGVLRDSVGALHALFLRASGMQADSPEHADSRETLLGCGKAISPLDAGRCVLDYARTTKFLRGVKGAIGDAQRRFPGETIHVLYAGCGPFAPLVLPLATVSDSQHVQFTLLDIHERVAECVRRVVEALELSAFVRAYVPCDATEYVHGDALPFHVLVIEAMQRALTKEPQVAIAMNLVPQMCENGILVPERVTLTAAWADVGAEITGRPKEGEAPEFLDGSEVRTQRVVLGEVFDLTAESACKFGRECFRDPLTGSVCLPGGTVRTRPPAWDRQELVILTTITVFGSIVVGDYESGLTYPQPLPSREPDADPGSLGFVYQLGAEPGPGYGAVAP
jgi:hypothetical protein